jgi:predicted heme/steroid binding protein
MVEFSNFTAQQVTYTTGQASAPGRRALSGLLGPVPAPATTFRHREPEERALRTLRTNAGDPLHPPTVLVTGGPGVGKTQFAVGLWAALTQGRSESDGGGGEVDFALWVTANSQVAVISAFSEAALVQGLGVEGEDDERRARRFREALRSTTSRWLIVLDDVARSADLIDWEPIGPSGRVIITSLSLDGDLLIPEREHVPLGVYSASEARDYLIARLSRMSDPEEVLQEADQLAEDLYYFPMALARAAAVIQEDGGTCASFRSQLADRASTLHTVLDQGELPLADARRRAVALTWSIAIDRADAVRPKGGAAALAVVASLLSPHGTPEQVLTSQPIMDFMFATGVRGSLPSTALGVGDVERAVRNLNRLSVLVRDSEGTFASIRMHGLAQRAIREQTAGPLLESASQAAADSLMAVWPRVEHDGHLSERLRTCVSALNDVSDGLLWRDGPHPVLIRAGESLDNVGLVTKAATYWEDLLRFPRWTAADRSAARIDVERRRAHSEGLGGQHRDAMVKLQRLSQEAEATLGARDALSLLCRYDAAHFQGECGDPHTAAEVLAELVEDCRIALGEDDRLTLRSRHAAAYWQGTAGDAAAAVTAFESVVEDRRRVLGDTDHDTLSSLGALAHFQGESGQPASAVQGYAALLKRLDDLGDDPQYFRLGIRHALARWRGENGDPARAAASLDKLRHHMAAVLGSSHPDVLGVRHSEAYWRGQAGEASRARAMFEELVLDSTDVLGADHHRTLQARAEGAKLSENAARAVEALTALLERQLRDLHADHPTTLSTRGDLAHWLGRSGQTQRALSEFAQLLQDRMRVLPAGHPHILGTRHALARWLGEAGHLDQTLQTLQPLVDELTRSLGPDHPYTLGARFSVMYWRRQAGDPSDPDNELVRLLEAQEDKFGPDHPATLGTRTEIAERLGLAGDAEGAVTAYAALLRDRQRLFGPDHRQTLHARQGLARWRGEAGNPQEAFAELDALVPLIAASAGLEHADTLAARRSRAYWRARAGDPTGAREDYASVVDDARRLLGEDHPFLQIVRRQIDELERRA